MEEKPKFDFQRHQMPKASKWYLIRIAIYVAVLIILGVLIAQVLTKKPKHLTEEELTNTTINPSF